MQAAGAHLLSAMMPALKLVAALGCRLKQAGSMVSKSKHANGVCPECGDQTEYRYRPFCSKRCADLDLSRWLRGAYAIPGGNADADDDGDEAEAFDLAQRSHEQQPSEIDDNDGGSRLH